jgi:3-isopropylmalate dehydratase small subunit
VAENFKFAGRAWRFEDDVDTDAIIPGKYLNLTSRSELGDHCMENVLPGFKTKVKIGDILVAGENFGCGSSREHAPIAIKACGISCVIAASISRLFYRNAISSGLPVFTIDDTNGINDGDNLEVDGMSGIVKNVNSGKEYSIAHLPAFMMDILAGGGLIPYLEKRLSIG